MKAAVPTVPLRDWLLTRPHWLDHETMSALVFAAKTFGASLLALYIAFWAALDTPRWAFLTVYVVSQPDSGLVLAKSFYRILGTIAGMLFATALVFGFAQYGELFVAATALWIGLCSFAARGASNFARYGFQLAGYTVAIVGLPAALNPKAAYLLVVARSSEIALGILCATLFSRLMFVRELSPKLVDLVRRLTHQADSFATALLDPDADGARVAAERAELAKGYFDVQEMQHSAFFESSEARVLDQPLRKLTQAAVELCAVAEAAASRSSGSFLGAQKKSSAVPATSQPGVSAAADASTASALIRAADERDVSLSRARLRASMAAFDRGAELPEPNIRCALWSDPLPAVLTGIRSALAVGIIAAFWFVTSWSTAPTAIVVAAVLCTLLAPMEQPDKLSIAAGVCILVAAIPVFATQFYLMPLAVDFLSMALTIAPLMLVCAFLMAQPRIGVFGLLGAVYFAYASNIDNVMTYDAAAFLNSSFAILVGVTVAGVMFAIFFPESPAGAVRRFR
ncbi:MAG: FUSC family protein, partial [Bradyrhizobium sp.]|nr:FUSC family protein [Bradyrhizobium sp.]